MAGPAFPINYDNLGYPVSTQTFTARQLALEAWGTEFYMLDIVYEFSNGDQKLSTDKSKTGIYGYYSATSPFYNG